MFDNNIPCSQKRRSTVTNEGQFRKPNLSIKKSKSKKRQLASIKTKLLVKAFEVYSKLYNPDEELIIIEKGCRKLSFWAVETLIFKIISKFKAQAELDKKAKVIEMMKSLSFNESIDQSFVQSNRRSLRRQNMCVTRNKDAIIISSAMKTLNISTRNSSISKTGSQRRTLFVWDENNKIQKDFDARKIILPAIPHQRKIGLASRVKNFLGLQRKVRFSSQILFPR